VEHILWSNISTVRIEGIGSMIHSTGMLLDDALLNPTGVVDGLGQGLITLPLSRRLIRQDAALVPSGYPESCKLSVRSLFGYKL
jgi:hypothetical protein